MHSTEYEEPTFKSLNAQMQRSKNEAERMSVKQKLTDNLFLFFSCLLLCSFKVAEQAEIFQFFLGFKLLLGLKNMVSNEKPMD